jgi:hypothetical protein
VPDRRKTHLGRAFVEGGERRERGRKKKGELQEVTTVPKMAAKSA